MSTWNKLGLTAGAIALAGGVLFTGVVSAQTPTREPTEAATAEATKPATEQERGWFFGRMGGRGLERGSWFFGRMGGHGLERGGWFFGRMGGPGGRMGRLGLGPLHEERLAIAADALGMEVEELQAALDDGQTLAEIAEAQGMDEEALQTALTEALDTYLEQAVEDGELTQAQADVIRERVDDALPFFLGGPRPGFGAGGALREIFQGERQAILAATLGITEEELEAALADGQTLREIAKEQGLDADEVRANFEQAVEQRLDAAVEAEEITQAQADALLERLAEFDPLAEGRGGRPFRGGWWR